MSREFCRGCPGPLAVFKKFVQKNFVRIFRSLSLARRQPNESQVTRSKGRDGDDLRVVGKGGGDCLCAF